MKRLLTSSIFLLTSLLPFVFFLLPCYLFSQKLELGPGLPPGLIQNQKTLDNMAKMFAKQQDLASARSSELFNVFKLQLEPDERQVLQYLYAYMPLSDLAEWNGFYFYESVKTTLKARKEMSWSKSIPEDVFLHFVLPLRVNNENLDSFRIKMYNEISARVKGLSMKSAALEVNHWCHEKMNYRGSDIRTSSPLASMKTSWGRCGEETTFTVSALRTVGIPARQVYTPRWAHSDDNHAWVEVWVDGKWYFMGACEPEPDLNMGWFAEPSRRCMLVHTRAYGAYFGDEPAVDNQERFTELNLIANYAPVKTFFVKVTDADKNPVKDAKVEYQLYNYSEFYPLAKTFTNARGTTSMTTGLGDLMIWASKGNLYDYKVITVENVDTVRLVISGNHKNAYVEEFDLMPPIEREPLPVSAQGQKDNALRLQKEDSIRNQYIKTFKDTVWATNLANKLNLNRDSVVYVITASYGNWREISGFLQAAGKNQKSLALRMLYVISDKDLRDTKSEILMDHLTNALKSADSKDQSNQDFFVRYVVSGRVSNEMMVGWRSFLQKEFDQDFKEKCKKNITPILSWIRQNIKINDPANAHSRAPLTPRGVYELKVCDKPSRDIFFVALCRSLNIPSRLDQARNIPQYWNGKLWQDVTFEKITKTQSVKGFLQLTNGNPSIMPVYYSTFTLAYFKDGVFRTLEYDEGMKLSDFEKKMEVDTGNYLCVTGNRLTNSKILTTMTFFKVEAGKTTDLVVKVRESYKKSEPYGRIYSRTFQMARFPDGEIVSAEKVLGDKGAILIWIDPDREPSRHVMVDIPAANEAIKKWGGNVIFLVHKDNVTQGFHPEDYKNLPEGSFFAFDNEYKILNQLENIKGRPLKNNLPIVIKTDSLGNLTYFSEGYRIGVGEQLAKELTNDR